MASIQTALDANTCRRTQPTDCRPAELHHPVDLQRPGEGSATAHLRQGSRRSRGVRDGAVRRTPGGPAVTSSPPGGHQAQSGPLHRRGTSGSHLCRRLLPAEGNTTQGFPAEVNITLGTRGMRTAGATSATWSASATPSSTTAAPRRRSSSSSSPPAGPSFMSSRSWRRSWRW